MKQRMMECHEETKRDKKDDGIDNTMRKLLRVTQG